MIWHWTYSAVLLVGSLAAIAFSSHFRREWARGLLISFSIVIAMLAASDLYFRAGDRLDLTEKSYPPDYHTFEDDLGKRAPPPGPYHVVSRLRSTGDTVYDITYTIGEDGFRETDNVAPRAHAVVFFGGSYTYGEGVGDGETYPAQFSKALNHRSRVINAGFSGFGPHQMLRLLETGKVDAATKGPVVAAYYLMIDNHMNRAAGLHWWNLNSPRYILDTLGNIQLDGLHRDNRTASLLAELEIQGGLAGRIGRALAEILVPSDARVDVTAAIMGKSAALIRQKYGAELYCLFWGTHWSKEFALLADKLEERGIKVLRVADFVPDLSAAAVGVLPGVENHPSPAFNERLGSALARFHLSTFGSHGEVEPRKGNELE